MIALIDGDICAYRCAASAENEEEFIAHARLDDLIRRILHDTNSDKYEIHLSGQENFRKVLYPEYKANRVQQRPRWLESCRERVVLVWSGKVTDGIEADDAIGISQTVYWTQDVATTVCSIDKDFFQLPGKHYQWEISGVSHGKSWTKQAIYLYQTPLEAHRHFYKQLMIGDQADNIKGVDGIGPKTAAKLIDHLDNELDMYEVVREKYNNDERLHLNCQLTWILRKENTPWTSPLERTQEQDIQP